MRRCWLALVLAPVVLGCGGSGGGEVPSALSLEAFAAPPAAARPWVRWWWPGADVAPEELAAEIEALAAAGFGGVEIQPFDAALDPEAPAAVLARRRAFDTPRYYALLRGALEAARAAGLQVDLTFGSGWPAGGQRIAAAESLQSLHYREWTLEGPQAVHLDARQPQPSHFYEIAEFAAETFGEQLARFLPEAAEPLAAVAAPIAGGSRSDSMLELGDTLELDRDGLRIISHAIGPDGWLDWQVPAGRWQVVVLFRGPAGGLVQLAAEPEPGLVLDHFAAQRVAEQLDHLFGPRSGLDAYYGDPLRAVFTDSFELKVERHWADGMLAEFERRRGYDLTPWLPALLLPGADNYIFEVGRLDRAPEFALSAEDHRVRHDFARTAAELFRERYLETKAAWLQARGLQARAQAYGLDVDVLRAAGAVHQPEAEQLYAGGSRLFLKAVAAGAHLYGRRRVSAEAMVFPLRDHMTTPLKVKAAADKAFAAGVDQLVFHGFAYDHPDDYGPTGWTPFSCRWGGANTFASHFGPRSPLFDALRPLTDYAARCQQLLRQGRPEADLAVLWPFLGFPTSLALEPGYFEPLLGGFMPGEPELREVPYAELAALFGEPVTDPRVAWLLALEPTLAALEDAGWTWEWVNPHALGRAAAESGAWRVGNMRFAALLLPALPAMEPELAEQLAALGRKAPLLVLGEPPAAQPGWLDHQAGDTRVRQAFERARRAKRARFTALAEAEAALAELGLEPAVALAAEPAGGLVQIQRRLGNGARVIFLANLEADARAVVLREQKGCPEARWLDAWTGRAHELERSDAALRFSLAGYESVFLVCGDGPAAAGALAPDPRPARPGPRAEEQLIDGWRLTADGPGVAAGGVALELMELADWRDLEPLRDAAATGVYSTTLDLPEAAAAGRAELDLGRVAGTARVWLDERELGRLLVSPFRLALPAELEPGEHALRIELEPPWRNWLVALGSGGDPRLSHFADKADTRIATGLLGPVRLRWE